MRARYAIAGIGLIAVDISFRPFSASSLRIEKQLLTMRAGIDELMLGFMNLEIHFHHTFKQYIIIDNRNLY